VSEAAVARGAARDVGRLDRAGTVASGVCAVHCAALALLPWLATTMVGVLARAWMEALLVTLALAIGATAIVSGFVRVHRDVRPGLLLLVGATCLGVRAALPEGSVVEVPCSLVGAACLITAHRLNSRLSRCACCR